MTKRLCNILLGIVILALLAMGTWYYFQTANKVDSTQGSVLVYIKEESGSLLVDRGQVQEYKTLQEPFLDYIA